MSAKCPHDEDGLLSRQRARVTGRGQRGEEDGRVRKENRVLADPGAQPDRRCGKARGRPRLLRAGIRDDRGRDQWTRTGEYTSPKTKAGTRRVPLSFEMVRFLTRHKLASSFSNDDRPVFASQTGGPLGHRNATRRGFEAAAELAGVEGVSFHSMRHAFASRMIDRGISSTVLAKVMGHESSGITERRYIHLFDRQRTDDAIREAMASTAATS